MNAQSLRNERLRNLILELNAETNEVWSIVSMNARTTDSRKMGDLKKEFEELNKPNSNALGEVTADDNRFDSQAVAVVRERQKSEEATNNILAQWRLVRSMLPPVRHPGVHGADQATRPRRLPLKLRKWMEAGNSESRTTENYAESGTACSGGGGKRRVACVITGLLYRWLCDRCLEWHAELTQRELLDSMDELVLDVVDSNVSSASAGRPIKSGKKSKKRDKNGNQLPWRRSTVRRFRPQCR